MSCISALQPECDVASNEHGDDSVVKKADAIRSIRHELSVISANIIHETQLAHQALDAIREGKESLLAGNTVGGTHAQRAPYDTPSHDTQDSHSWKSSIIQEKRAFQDIIQASVNLARHKEKHMEELIECEPLLQVLQAVSSIAQQVNQVKKLIDICRAGSGGGAGASAGLHAHGRPDISLQEPGALLQALAAALEQLPGKCLFRSKEGRKGGGYSE